MGEAREDGLSNGWMGPGVAWEGAASGEHPWGVGRAMESVGNPLSSRQTWFSENLAGE